MKFHSKSWFLNCIEKSDVEILFQILILELDGNIWCETWWKYLASNSIKMHVLIYHKNIMLWNLIKKGWFSIVLNWVIWNWMKNWKEILLKIFDA